MVCNKRSRPSERQRSGSKEFSILCIGRCKPLGSLNSFLSDASQVSGVSSVFLGHLASSIPPAPQQSPWGWQYPKSWSYGSLHSHLEATSHWWLWHFLLINMAGEIFILHTQKKKTKNTPNSLGLFPYQISPPVIKFWTNHQSSKQNITTGGSRELCRNLLRSLIQHISISIVMTIKVKDTLPSWNQ